MVWKITDFGPKQVTGFKVWTQHFLKSLGEYLAPQNGVNIFQGIPSSEWRKNLSRNTAINCRQLPRMQFETFLEFL